MKKLALAAAALLAIASLASAETFEAALTGNTSNTYSFAQTSGTDVATVGTSTLSGHQNGGTKNYLSINNWVWNGSTFSFDVNIADGYTLTELTIDGGFRAGGTSAPQHLVWSVGGQNGTTYTIGTGTAGNVDYADTITGLNLTGPVTVSLAATGNTLVNNSTRDGSWLTGGAVNVYNTTFTGTVTKGSTPSEVPEPATMALLGLGGLALALRRRIRK